MVIMNLDFENDVNLWVKLGSMWKKMNSKEKADAVKEMLWFSICNLSLHATIKPSDLDTQKIIAYLDKRSTKTLKTFSKDAFIFIAHELQQMVAPNSDFERFHLRSIGHYFDLDYMDPIY